MAALFLFSSCSIFQPYHGEKKRTSGRDRDSGYVMKERGVSEKPPFWYRDSRLRVPKDIGDEGIIPLDDSNKAGAHRFPKILRDDMDWKSMDRAIMNQLAAMKNTDLNQEIQLGDLVTTQGWLRETLLSFLRLIRKVLSAEEFDRRVRENFIFYKAGRGENMRALFTGYYIPVIEASRVPTEEYKYPLYQKPLDPPDLNFSKAGWSRKVGYSKPSRNWRDYTRREIDGEGILKNKNLEIAWLKNDMDRYFLHIQGSGRLQFPDGTAQMARYAASNSYSYQGIGKIMVEDGKMKLEDGSMQGIKEYFRKHPEDIPKYLYKNSRYIFFDLSGPGNEAMGSGGGELVGGRSIATDKTLYPAGGLAFIQLKKPVLNPQNEIISWVPFSRFVVDQDTGNAIRGRGRVDLFFGKGYRSGVMAGHFRERGAFYYLLKK
ncbi:MAG: MltA domain-containing protein [Nitrospinota bacterium]|nr:MltA domain-containing protein [Nitrospinota bacterium]